MINGSYDNAIENFNNAKDLLLKTRGKENFQMIQIYTNLGKSHLLSGDLGAGKTELVRYIVEGSGNDSFVRSPTFVLINNYSGEKNITHCDFYRIDLGAEVE